MQLSRRLWIRASLFAVLGVVTSLVAVLVEPLIPIDIPGKVGADAVGNILNILASSMLAVTTFSLSVMVASFGAATQNVTPRATRLLMQDNTSQTVLSTFVGSFLFSLVGIISLGMGAYGGSGRVVLFAVTLGVILLIVIAILRWVEHLTHFGRVGDTTRRVEIAAKKALDYRSAHPYLGARLMGDDNQPPDDARSIRPSSVGYVQYVDVAALQKVAEEQDIEIFVLGVPGRFMDLHSDLARLAGMPDDAHLDDVAKAVRSAFSINHERSFDQDPRFGLAVLAEIASRALSPAVNDIGTAIDVIGRQVRLLSGYAAAVGETEQSEPEHPRVLIAALKVEDLFEDAFAPIARDGAGLIEVQLRLQKAFSALASFGGDFATAASASSKNAYARAEKSLVAESDREHIKQAVR